MKNESELLDGLANAVYSKGLSAPAIFLLEMYKPLAGLFYNLSLAVFPALNAIFGFERFRELSQVIRSPELIEKLIQIIELKQKELSECRE